jgi:uncharacterized protein YjbI with pentapeptide repeats
LENWVAAPPKWAGWAAYFVAAMFLAAALWFAAALFLQLLALATHARTHSDQINKLLLALAGLIGAPFVVWRVLIASQQNSIALQNVRNTLFSKAVEQLGAVRERKESTFHPENDGKIETASLTEANFEVRLGAIYALEKLAREDLDLHWPIMETLCAYVRQNAGAARRPPTDLLWSSLPPSLKERENSPAQKYRETLKPPTVDVAAALQVLGRRSAKGREFELAQSNLSKNRDLWRLNLSGCQLAFATLSGLDFCGANFSGSVLLFADFQHGDFGGANFGGAYLAYADLRNSRFTEADFQKAHLENAKLVNAQLQAADLTSVELGGADLTAANLQFVSFYRDGDFVPHEAEYRLQNPLQSLYSVRHILFVGADLSSAFLDFLDLRGAEGLTEEQIDQAYGNEYTTLPFRPPISPPQNDRWVSISSPPEARLQRRLAWLRDREKFLQSLRAATRE